MPFQTLPAQAEHVAIASIFLTAATSAYLPFCIAKKGQISDQGDQDKLAKELSFIYFPLTKTGFLKAGHAELCLGWDAYFALLKKFSFEPNKLRQFIDNVTKDGHPFMRIVFGKELTDQLKKDFIREIDKKENYLDCSRSVCAMLEQQNICKVPFVVSLSPMLTTMYLTVLHKLGYGGIKRIEFYSNSNLTQTVTKTVPGIVREACYVTLPIAMLLCMRKMVLNKLNR